MKPGGTNTNKAPEMSLNASSEEPATSTPSKSSGGKNEVDPDSAISYRTIPHGLTYKHETRHRSSYRRHSTSPKRTSSAVELKRHPLTCVKDTNFKKLDIVGAKQDLTSILTTVDKNKSKNKENGKGDNGDNGDKKDTCAGSDGESDSSAHISTGDLSEDISSRGLFPVPSLANGHVPDDIESSPVNSHQDRVVKKKQSIRMSRKRNAASVTISESKRPHFSDSGANDDAVLDGSSRLPLIQYHRSNSTSSYRTPVRHDGEAEKSPKKAPSRAHHSRVIDESRMQQDGDENPALDPDNSPLANVSQGSIVDQKIEGETEVFNQLKRAAKSSIHELDAESIEGSHFASVDSGTDGSTDDGESNDSDDSNDSNLRMSPVRFSSKAISPLSKMNAKADSIEQDKILASLNEKEKQIDGAESRSAAIFTSEQVQEIRCSFDSTVSALKESLKAKSEQNSQLGKQLSGLKLEVVDTKTKMEQVESEKKQLEATVKTLKIESSSATDYATNLDKQFNVVSLKLRVCESKLTRYKELYSELMATARGLEKEVSKGKKTVSQLKQKLAEVSQKLDSAQASKSELQSSLELKKAEVKSLLEEKSENDIMIRNLKHINDESDAQLKKLNARLNATKEKLEDLRKRNDSLSAKMASSSKQIKDKSAELESMKREKDMAVANLNSLKTKLQAIEASNRKLTLEKEAADSKISKAQKELDELDKKYLEVKKSRSEEWQSKLASGQQNVEKLNVRIKSLEQEKAQLDKALKSEQEARSNANEKKREEGEAMETRLESLEKELTSAKAKIADNDKEMETQMEKLAQDLYLQYSAKHEQKVATLKKGYEMKWMGKVKKFTRDNDALKREIASLKKRLEVETNEKKQLVKLWDEYVSLERKGPKMKS